MDRWGWKSAEQPAPDSDRWRFSSAAVRTPATRSTRPETEGTPRYSRRTASNNPAAAASAASRMLLREPLLPLSLAYHCGLALYENLPVGLLVDGVHNFVGHRKGAVESDAATHAGDIRPGKSED